MEPESGSLEDGAEVLYWSENHKTWLAARIKEVGRADKALWVSVSPPNPAVWKHAVKHKMMRRSGLVWAKLKGYPPWPAVAHQRCCLTQGEVDKDLVYFLGDNTHQLMLRSSLVPFTAETWEHMSGALKKKDRVLQRAAVEAIRDLQERGEAVHDGMSEYLKLHSQAVDTAKKQSVLKLEAAKRAVEAASANLNRHQGKARKAAVQMAASGLSSWTSALEAFDGEEIICKQTTGLLKFVDGDAKVQVSENGAPSIISLAAFERFAGSGSKQTKTSIKLKESQLALGKAAENALGGAPLPVQKLSLIHI
eukprot:TRINITY_DN55063_c0_g1_i3.p1 TRINITY_DN55063_c0_g1~~TRINITY_DN55063_c0_g1_i3.p1  ORF type:complete len:308 (-),score=87.32 TRINITY_DN55063_c0_g1_i3:100-1023(-)